MNNTSSDGFHSSTAAPVPGVETFLEGFIPGFSVISKLFSLYFQIDLSAYLTSILFLVAAAAGVNYGARSIWGLARDYCTSTAEIRLDDEIYNYVMFWVSLQGFSKKTHRFVAGTSTNSELVYMSDDDCDSDDEEEKETEDDYMFDGDSEKDNYWERIIRRDKFKPLRYTPSTGKHLFWYKGNVLAFTREKDEQKSTPWIANSESLYISCLGRNPAILKDLLQEAQRVFVERDGNKTIIYRGQRRAGGGEDISWVRCMARHQRPFSTVVLDQEQKRAFTDDMREYLHPLTRRWYSNRGIPYRRGYLLHGPPGTGKTSLCFAAAGLFGLKIYVVSLNSGRVTEDGLASLFQKLPRRCIVLLEDIDSAGITQKRAANSPVEKEVSSGENAEGSDKETSAELTPNDEAVLGSVGISLSALLNIIDGVASSEGRILIMTTNHPEKLDDALLRPGRVDLTVAFGYADTPTLVELFRAIYTTMEGDFPPQPGTQNGVKPVAEKPSQTSVEKTSTDSKAAKATSETSNFIPSSTFLRHSHQYSDSEIVSKAENFASKVPSGKFTPAEIQGYLLKYKNDPDAAIDQVAGWVSSVLEEREKKIEKKSE